MKMTSDQTRELLKLLVDVDDLSKVAAKQVLNGLALEGRFALLLDLRRRKLERSGQVSLPLGKASVSPVGDVKGGARAKKVPYTLLLPPDQIEALRSLAAGDDTSVSHHIRQAIRVYLRSRPV